MRLSEDARWNGTGVSLVRGGAGTALVGSHDEVAECLADDRVLGIDEFILSGHPHVEEPYWFAEGDATAAPTWRPRPRARGAGRRRLSRPGRPGPGLRMG